MVVICRNSIFEQDLDHIILEFWLISAVKSVHNLFSRALVSLLLLLSVSLHLFLVRNMRALDSQQTFMSYSACCLSPHIPLWFFRQLWIRTFYPVSSVFLKGQVHWNPPFQTFQLMSQLPSNFKTTGQSKDALKLFFRELHIKAFPMHFQSATAFHYNW